MGSRLDTFIEEQCMLKRIYQDFLQHIHVLKGKYYKQMTIKSRDMEIHILVFGPLLWPNHFIVLNFAVLT